VLEHDFQESVGCWVGLTARAFERAVNDELAPLGITFPQWQVLGWLAFEPDLSQTQLAQRMRVEAPTLVGILDRMERDGWITRQPAPDDRRKKLVRPMPKVQPVWEQIMAACRRVRAQALQGIEAEELQQVKGVLERIRQNLTADVLSELEAR
jgi:MarR family transcriptional regulator for hemolysin